MQDLLPSLLVILLGSTLLVRLKRKYPDSEFQLLALAYAAHVLGAFAQVWITRGYYSAGDMLGYHRVGKHNAAMMRSDASQYVPEVLKVIAHQDASPAVSGWAGGATDAMAGIAGLLELLLNDSLYAVCVTLSIAAFFGQLALYRVFRESYHPRLHIRLLAATMLLPSAVYWTSGLLKETVAVAGFGWCVLGIHRWLRGSRLRGPAIAIVGALVVATVKGYILFALGVSAAVWWYADRAIRLRGEAATIFRPVYLLIGIAVLIGVVVGMGELFPSYSVDQLGAQMAKLQRIGHGLHGGSNYSIADPAERSLVGQLAFAPLAFLTALFRPFPFEASSAAAFVNSLETAFLTILFVRSFTRFSLRRIWIITTRSPLLIFSVAFTLAFGVAVGLASTNLGSLSRYRAPMMPFWVVLLLIWNTPAVAVSRHHRANPVPSITPRSHTIHHQTSGKVLL